MDAIAWSPDGQVLVTASDMEIYVWDTKVRISLTRLTTDWRAQVDGQAGTSL